MDDNIKFTFTWLTKVDQNPTHLVQGFFGGFKGVKNPH